MDSASFFPPRWRLLLLAGGAGLFAAIGLLLTGSHIPAWRWTGVLMLVGFGLATATLLARALRPGPTVVIDADGITDRTTLVPTGLLRWPEIAAIRKREIGRGWARERLLEVVLVDPDRFRSRPRSWSRRVADRVRAWASQPDVSIPGSMVDRPLAAVIAEIQRQRPSLDVLELPPVRPGRLAWLFRSRTLPAPKQHPDLPRW